MSQVRPNPNPILNAASTFMELLGKRTVKGVAELGYACGLFTECIFWLLIGRHRRQPVRLNTVFQEARAIGVNAALIASLLCFAVGIMLAIQGIEALRKFGAESTVIMGIAISVTQEFAPLIVSILVAGRSGSAITARIGTMQESQEIDALRVIGISPVRFLAAPILLAMLVMLPTLTILGDIMGILGGAVYTSLDLKINLAAYIQRTLEVLTVDNIRQGLIKSLIFAAIIAMVGLVNGFQVTGGSEGVGKSTTRSVVLSISFIIMADMMFTYLLNR
jgi:phospholipid/cholesterol/gamma-HCH transport system permease protein